GRIERIDIDLDSAGPCNADESDGKRYDVGRHHGDAVAPLHAELGLQIGAEGVRQLLDVAVGERAAETAECNFVGIALHCAVEKLDNRGVPVGVNFGWNVPVRFRPVPGRLPGLWSASAPHALQQTGPHRLLPSKTPTLS